MAFTKNQLVEAIGPSQMDTISATTAKTRLGLGTMATQNANNVAITGGKAAFTGQANSDLTTLVDGANIATDCDTGNSHQVTLAGNRTLDNPTNLKAGATYVWKLIQDPTGSRTLAYGSAFKFPGGTAPTLTTAANAVDLLAAWCDGTNLFCNTILDVK